MYSAIIFFLGILENPSTNFTTRRELTQNSHFTDMLQNLKEKLEDETSFTDNKENSFSVSRNQFNQENLYSPK